MKEIFGDSESQSIFLKCFMAPEHIHKPIILHAAIALRRTNCSSNLYGVNFFPGCLEMVLVCFIQKQIKTFKYYYFAQKSGIHGNSRTPPEFCYKQSGSLALRHLTLQNCLLQPEVQPSTHTRIFPIHHSPTCSKRKLLENIPSSILKSSFETLLR